ncbi:MAG: sigma-54 factor interaction domain-containing protein, partial [Bdellovibrio sp.]|nr:sigma-54 factor interaction domain-containing protein [Bdellovibrio sp.]
MAEGRDIIAKSPAFLSSLTLARKVAESCSNVLITGESGTGKEVLAQYIHNWSLRRNKSFVALNCAAIPEQLLESELFGYARGAFTGANTAKAGLLEEAEGGTLFLDEIADLDIGMQAKLLRVLQERKIKRLGENSFRPVNIRIICATHENLQRAVANRKFREDLFFRLNVIS